MKLKLNTQKAQNFLRAYKNGKNCDIWGAYCRPSQAKIDAYFKILAELYKMDGIRLRITGASCHHFSCGYLYTDASGCTWLRYHTHASAYDIPYFEGGGND